MRCVMVIALALYATSAASVALAQTEQQQRWDADRCRGQAEDQQRGYKAMTLEDFALDGKDPATREAKVSLGGSYAHRRRFRYPMLLLTHALAGPSRLVCSRRGSRDVDFVVSGDRG